MIEIFYIAYLKKNKYDGITYFKNFLKSYENYNAGIEHKLTILLKGYENNIDDYNEIKKICQKKNINTLDTTDTGMDFGGYLEGAKQSEAEYILCLNSSSEIMCDNWLKKLYSPVLENKNYKMIGAGGLWEHCQTYLLEHIFANNFIEHLKVILNKIDPFRRLYRFIFTPYLKGFPNYAVRAQAFLIDRNLYLQYFEKYKLPKNKLDSYQIESGKESLTNFVLKNHNICVIDKYGKIFEKEDFDKSNTYRSSKSNYIIKDKQTEKYEKANFLIKMYLRRICWGKF